jgi:hypothetical protein
MYDLAATMAKSVKPGSNQRRKINGDKTAPTDRVISLPM